MANIVARYAEDALWEHCRLLDYNNRARFALYIFLSPAEFAASNMYPMPLVKLGGVTPIRNNSAAILFPGTHRELQKRVRAEVAKLIMEDFYFGGGIQASIQNTVLLYLPDWYEEGFTAYLGEGWDYSDELWLHSLEHANLLDYALEGNSEIHHVARKSIWYFIANQYGKEKLAEIFYMTRLARSAEDGIVHVLGITLKTLTERWREFVLQRITENNTFRDPIAEQASKVRFNDGGRLLNMALNPVLPVAALQMENNGKQQVYLYNLEQQSMDKTPIKGAWRTDQFASMNHILPMVWSPDGKMLLSTAYTKRGEQLCLWNSVTGELSITTFQPRIERILSMAWSHDGRQIVISALKAGAIDLYRGTPGSNSFVQITDDMYDDLEPVFSLDDQRIYFASTRSSADQPEAEQRYDANKGSTDIWEIEPTGGNLRQVSHSVFVDERPVYALSSFELLVRTNQSGIWNLERRQVFSGDSIPQTNLVQGMQQVQASDSMLLFTSPDRGKLQLYQANPQQFLRQVVALKSPLRMREDKANMAQSRAVLDQIKRDSIAKMVRNNDPKKPSETKADTAGTKKVKYYVFDEEGDEQKQRRAATRSRGTIIRKEPPAKPDMQAVTIKGPSISKAEWATERVTTRLGYDPIFRLSMLMEARLRDQLGNKVVSIGFQPYLDLRSADTYFRFQENSGRVDVYGGITRSTRFLNRSGFAVRYNATRLDAGATLPINRFLSAGLSAHGVFIDRRNIQLRLPSEFDGHETLAGIKAEINYDHTERNGVFAKKGTTASVAFQDVVSLKGRYNQFATATWDFRKYIPVQHFVLATRVAGAMSTGRNPQKYFVGGTEDWITGKFSNTPDLPITSGMADFHYMGYGTPIRGFRFNARNGSRYLVANAELRMPMSRIFRNSFNTNPLYNVELIPFFDFGTAWTQGNPFSQRNPIDTKQINSYPLTITVQTLKSPFIMGFGAGARTQVFGYGVRFDLAWAIEDYTLLKPLLHVSLAKNF
jgi:hypothetical protein